MVAFWRDLVRRVPQDGQLGAAMPMPPVPTRDGAGGAADGGEHAPWLQMLAPIAETTGLGVGGSGGADGAAGGPVVVAPTRVSAVWEPAGGGGAGARAAAPSYDACFQGF
jgi:hypothetical protein